ncbi:MAG: hypothetical protein EOP06_26885 [Proteobacteria bacterium]|nr:MAG: hypothetical protein EOP06_26885 [Pseudomonadota bacterium]
MPKDLRPALSLLKPDGKLHPIANKILEKEIKKQSSCRNLSGKFAFVVWDKTKKRLRDDGVILCKSRYCFSCSLFREIKARKILENTIQGYLAEDKQHYVAFLTLTLPPLNPNLLLYDFEHYDLYKLEADVRRLAMLKFAELIRRSPECEDVRGFFRTEEVMIAIEKWYKKAIKDGDGNHLNMHFHCILFMCGDESSTDPLAQSTRFHEIWLKAYAAACKKLKATAGELMAPEKIKGEIKGSAVYLKYDSFTDETGSNHGTMVPTF